MAAAVGSHLSGGRVNVGLLRECARRELLQCLNRQPGSKVTWKYELMYLIARCSTQVTSASSWKTSENVAVSFEGVCFPVAFFFRSILGRLACWPKREVFVGRDWGGVGRNLL